MPVTEDQIRGNVSKLEQAGRSQDEINRYIKMAVDDMRSGASEPVIKTGGLASGTSDQTLGKVPTPSGAASFFKEALVPKREDIPAIAGATAFGFGTGGMGLIPAALFTGLGAGFGEAAKQLYKRGQNSLGFPKFFRSPAPATSIEAAKDIGGQAVAGATSELVGRAAGKLLTPFGEGMTKDVAKQVASARSLGVEPPLANMTENKFPQAIARVAESSPFGGAITAEKKAAVESLQQAARNMADNISPDKPPEQVGEIAKEGLFNFKKLFKEKKNELYVQAMPALKDKPVSLDNTIGTLKQIIENRKIFGDKSESAKFKQLLSKLETKDANPSMLIPGTDPGITTFGGLKNLRSRIIEEVGPFNLGNTGYSKDLERVEAALTKDLDVSATAVSEDLAGKMKAADQFYATGINKLKDKLSSTLLRTAEKNPSNIHRLLIRKDAPELVSVGRELLGEEGFNDVRRQWYDSVLRDSVRNMGGKEMVSPAAIATNLRKLGTTADELFGDSPALAQQLDKIRDTALVLTRGRDITEGSPTAAIQQNFIPLLASFAGMLHGASQGSLKAALFGLGGGLGALSAQAAASKAVTSKLGKKILTTGFPMAGKIVRRAVQPAAQLGIEAIFKKRNETP